MAQLLLGYFPYIIESSKVRVNILQYLQIKSKFFDPSFVKSIFSNLTPLSASYPEIRQQLETTLTLRFDQFELTPEVSQLLEDLQFSLFSMMVYALIMQKANWSFYIDGEGRLSVIDLNKLMEDPLSELPELHEILSDRTIAMVNLRKIITKLTDSNDFFKNDLQIGMVMSENSVQQLKKLFKENNVKEIAITLGENDRPIIRTKQHISLEECEKEIRKLQKKGNFSNVAIKTRDGKIQVFEKTDLIKL